MVTSRLSIGLELFYCLDIVVNLPLGWAGFIYCQLRLELVIRLELN